jgi:hypothetical protein
MVMKITIDKTKWNGADYNIADPYLRSWNIDANEATWNDLESWCQQTFGPVGDPWEPTAERWYYNGGKFYFKRDSDLTLFLIKWS